MDTNSDIILLLDRITVLIACVYGSISNELIACAYGSISNQHGLQIT